MRTMISFSCLSTKCETTSRRQLLHSSLSAAMFLLSCIGFEFVVVICVCYHQCKLTLSFPVLFLRIFWDLLDTSSQCPLPPAVIVCPAPTGLTWILLTLPYSCQSVYFLELDDGNFHLLPQTVSLPSFMKLLASASEVTLHSGPKRKPFSDVLT